MSRENLENARTGIDAWNRGDLDEWLAGFAPEAEPADELAAAGPSA